MRCEPTIRRARPADLTAVVRLDAASFGDNAWSAASWTDEFARLGDTRLLLVAEPPPPTVPPTQTEPAQVVGFAVLIVPGDPADPVDLARIGVAPAWRRTGVAAGLVEAALPPGRTVLLEVAEGNKAARALYERHGFAEIGRRKGYYPAGEDALILRRIG